MADNKITEPTSYDQTKELVGIVEHDVRSWLTTQYSLVRLRIIGGVSRLLGFVLLMVTVILGVFATLIFGSIAAISALSSCMPVWAACLVFVALFILLIIIVISVRTTLFVNPFIKRLSKMLFAKEGQIAKEERLRKEAEND